MAFVRSGVPMDRRHAHALSSTSNRVVPSRCGRWSGVPELSTGSLHEHRTRRTAARALAPVPKLDPRKLSVVYLDPSASEPLPEPLPPTLPPRRYTVTHNDLTARLQLSVGEDFNTRQISNWYTRLVRDEVCAEWSFYGHAALHLHCHVSGAALWLAPARYRNFVFKREMPLVLDCILYAERDLLGSHALWSAPIFIHFEAEESDLARVEYWGSVGQWIEREDADSEAHLARVAYTLRGAAPAVPGTMLHGSLLQSALKWLADVFVAKPRPPSASAVATVKAAAGRDTGVVASVRRRVPGSDASEAEPSVAEAAALAAQSARGAARERAPSAEHVGAGASERRWQEKAPALHRCDGAAVWHAPTMRRRPGGAGVPHGWHGSGALVAGAARMAPGGHAARPAPSTPTHVRRAWPEGTRARRLRRWRGRARGAPATARVACAATLRRMRLARRVAQHATLEPSSSCVDDAEAGRAERRRRGACTAVEVAAPQQQLARAPHRGPVGAAGGLRGPQQLGASRQEGVPRGGVLVQAAARFEAPADWGRTGNV